jgi:hypothetical protein
MRETRTARAVFQVGDRYRVTEAVKDPFSETHQKSSAHGIYPLRINTLRDTQLELSWIDSHSALRAIVDGTALITNVNP